MTLTREAILHPLKRLTVASELKQLAGSAANGQDPSVGRGQVIGGVAVDVSQQAQRGAVEDLGQEHRGRDGSLSETQLHTRARREHHRHVVGVGREHEDSCNTVRGSVHMR